MIWAPITIGRYAWIGARAVVQMGLTVGDGAILGLGAVATRDLEAWSVNAGVPARTIRRQVGLNDIGSMPPRVRDVAEVLPRGLAPDIADLYWEFMELKPESVHSWLDGNNVRAQCALSKPTVPLLPSGGTHNSVGFPFSGNDGEEVGW